MDRLPEALEKYVTAAAIEAGVNRAELRDGLLAFLNAAEKDGWGMKPRKPTPKMIEAADHVLWYPVSQRYSVDVDAIADAYCAMFDAAKDEGP